MPRSGLGAVLFVVGQKSERPLFQDELPPQRAQRFAQGLRIFAFPRCWPPANLYRNRVACPTPSPLSRAPRSSDESWLVDFAMHDAAGVWIAQRLKESEERPNVYGLRRDDRAGVQTVKRSGKQGCRAHHKLHAARLLYHYHGLLPRLLFLYV